MKRGKRKNSRLPSEAPSAGSCNIRELDLDGEVSVHQERDEAPEDSGSEAEVEQVAGEEEEKDEESEELQIETGNGDGEATNVRPKLAEGFYEIETLRRKRTRKGQVQYLIKWRDWPERANTWEPVENLLSCSDVIDAFEESLQSGKQRLTRKRKRKFGATQTQPKIKQQQQQQQQCSPAAATYNVPAVRVRIIEEPTPSPPLNVLKATNPVDCNGSELKSKVDKVVNGNALLDELKGAMSTNENFVDISGNGLANGFPKVNGTEFYQSDRCTGAKKRKSGSVRRFIQETTSAVMHDMQDALAGGPLATFVQEGSNNHELVGGDFVCRNKSGDSKDGYTITKLISPISYSASFSNDMPDVSVTFLAKRSDGKETMVDNKFLKMNNPLLLINFYEQHMRINPTE